jgi:hypothetical protein
MVLENDYIGERLKINKKMSNENELIKRIIEKVQINYLILNMREYAKLTTDERQKLLLELKKQNAKLIKKWSGKNE